MATMIRVGPPDEFGDCHPEYEELKLAEGQLSRLELGAALAAKDLAIIAISGDSLLAYDKAAGGEINDAASYLGRHPVRGSAIVLSLSELTKDAPHES